MNEMNWYWIGIGVLLIIAFLVAYLAITVASSATSMLQVIPFIAVILLILVGFMKLDKGRLNELVKQDGLENVVIDLYTEGQHVKDIADSLDLTSKEVYKILKDNDIL